MQCGAEAHSHQVGNATSWATVCLKRTGIDKTQTFSVLFFFLNSCLLAISQDQIVKSDWFGTEIDHLAI